MRPIDILLAVHARRGPSPAPITPADIQQAKDDFATVQAHGQPPELPGDIVSRGRDTRGGREFEIEIRRDGTRTETEITGGRA